MAPEEHRPIVDRNPPIALLAVAVGLAVGFGSALVHRHRAAPPPAAPTLAEPNAPDAPPPTTTTPTPTTSTPPSAPPPLPSIPGVNGTSTTATGGTSSTATLGVTVLDRAAVVARYLQALGSCGEVRHLGSVDVVRCATASYEDEAVVAEVGGKVHVAASASHFAVEAPPPAPGELPASCGPYLHFVALPAGASNVSGGGSGGSVGERGTCRLFVPGVPASVLATLAANVFGAGPHDDDSWRADGIERFESRGLRDGVYWRIEVVGAPLGGGSWASIVRFNPGAVPAPRPLVLRSQRVDALEHACLPGLRCDAPPCVAWLLASQPAEHDVRAGWAWDAAADRCLYAVVGEPAAPARVAPVDAMLPNRPR